jgi:hypothetical protein
MDKEKRSPPLKKERTAIWMRATPAINPINVKTSKMLMMTRTKGIRMTPPPGCMISEKKDVIMSGIRIIEGKCGKEKDDLEVDVAVGGWW